MSTMRLPAKRVVFIDKHQYAHIMGVLDPNTHEIKVSIDFMHNGEAVHAGLVKVTPRMILYREFDKVKNAFHPAQV